jgi:hypothetical protein
MSLPVGLPALADSDLVGQVARILTQSDSSGSVCRRVPKWWKRGLPANGISRAPVREAGAPAGEAGAAGGEAAAAAFSCASSKSGTVDEIYDLRLCVERHASVLASRISRPKRGTR